MRLPNTSRPSGRLSVVAVTAILAASAGVAGCSIASPDAGAAPQRKDAAGPSASATASAAPAATVALNVPTGQRVDVAKKVSLSVSDGTFDDVRVTAGKGKTLEGSLSADKTSWTATGRLQPGQRYRVQAVAVNDSGDETRENSTFRTQDLTLDEQTYPSFAPLKGETVGVGMPVIVHFDVPVKDKASIEKHLSVQTSPQQVGAWHWINDNEVHWRPRTYWKPGTDVTVKADIDSVPAGNGIYGQMSRTSTFHVGTKVISHVNVQTHRMNVFVNGKMQRSIPISAGKPGFTTRSGVKVIIEKFRHKRMDAATTGISPGSPEYYNISNVEYAMRVTYSGEFVHAAPWSVGTQGSVNTSHGCVGMSTENAAWLYNLSKRGDVVDVTGSDRHMTLDNGYGDWNESFAKWKQGSALTGSNS